MIKKKVKKKVKKNSLRVMRGHSPNPDWVGEIFYSKKLTINVGNYQSVSIEFGATTDEGQVSDLINFVNMTVKRDLLELGENYVKIFFSEK